MITQIATLTKQLQTPQALIQSQQPTFALIAVSSGIQSYLHGK